MFCFIDCSGLKQQQPQDSDEDSSQHSMASKKPALPSPSSPPFSPTSQPIPVPKQNIFNQDFFLSQKSLLENFPSKMPLLMAPGAMGLQQPNTSHFVCQGCGIKFKSISNLKVGLTFLMDEKELSYKAKFLLKKEPTIYYLIFPGSPVQILLRNQKP